MTPRVLIIDDDEFNREAIEELLLDAGYAVSAAPHGKAALEMIAESPPDLILLDIYMSVMDGPEFARVYRQMPGPHAPMIVITGHDQAADQARQIGADGFLGKPLDPADLLKAVGSYLGVGAGNSD